MTGTTANVYAGIDTHQNTNHVGIINEVGKKLEYLELWGPPDRAVGDH